MTLFALCAISLGGCTLAQMIKMAKEQKLTITPNPLEVHGDSVIFEMSAILPVKLLKKDKLYTVSVLYKTMDQKLNLGEIPFKLSEYPNADKENPKASKKFGFAYNPDLKKGLVSIIGTASDINNKSKATPELTIASGIITTSKLATPGFYSFFAPHQYNSKEELESIFVNFGFDKAESKLLPKDLKGKVGLYFENFIKSKKTTRVVEITGTHSPEGSERKNSELSELRARAVKEYYANMMKKYNYNSKADSIVFNVKSVVDEWSGLKAILDTTSKLTVEEKQQIMEVVNGSEDFTSKELKLQSLPVYPKLFKSIYPILRTAKTDIGVVKKKKTFAEISMLGKSISNGTTSSDSLRDDELAFAATLTPIESEKEAIYKAAIKKNDAWYSHNNLGALYLAQAIAQTDISKRKELLDKAKIHLEISKTRQESAVNSVNLASAYLMSGDKLQAANALVAASKLSPGDSVLKGMNSLKGYLEITDGKYTSAISSLTQGFDDLNSKYNLGLAYLLNKDFEKAGSKMSEIKNNETALSYYVSAIIGARMDKSDVVYTNLKAAISKDGNLKAKALEDLEFSKYKASEQFMNAIK